MAKQPKSEQRLPSKIRPVNIKTMRVPPALVIQREFRPAWGNYLAANLDLNDLGFPIINARDGVNWLVDGQHRIYALKENGFGEDQIDCEVFDNLTDQQMADLFLSRSRAKAIGPYDKFHVACTAGYKRELDIRRAVESNGVKVGRNKEENTVSAIGALGKVYDRAGSAHNGEVVVGQVVRTIKQAFAGDPVAFESGVIEGLGLVFNRYNGKTNERDLAARLAATTVRGLLRRAESQRERTGNLKSQCIAATVVDIYNRGLGPRDAKRLPGWWKEAE
jgi:hypothetical protein